MTGCCVSRLPGVVVDAACFLSVVSQSDDGGPRVTGRAGGRLARVAGGGACSGPGRVAGLGGRRQVVDPERRTFVL